MSNNIRIRLIILSLALINLYAPQARAQILGNNTINILSYGAKGDCQTDDSYIINKAITSLENLNGWPAHSGKVYFPKAPGGCYLVDNPIILSGDSSGQTSITLEGEGQGVSVIRAGAAMTTTGQDAVLVKDNNWNVGHTIEDITFDANGLANHAIHVFFGADMHFTRVEGLNGLQDDMRIEQWGENFISESNFSNNPNLNSSYTIPPYNVYIYGTASSASAHNVFTNNLMTSASIAAIYDLGWKDNFFGNQAFNQGKYDFVAGGGSKWVGNMAYSSTDSDFVVVGWGANLSSNTMLGAQNHGVCILPNIANVSVFGNTMNFTGTGPSANWWQNMGNGVVQAANANMNADSSYNCGTSAVQTKVWGTAANNYQNNLVLNNTPVSSENLWNTIYPVPVNNSPTLVGIGTSAPQSQLDVKGEARVGNSNAPCTGENTGAIRYNSPTQSFNVCNGTNWAALGWAGT